MSTVNKVILIGHLGDEVKMHNFEGGGCIGRFPLATNETYINKNSNEKVTNVEWHNIVVKNKQAEVCQKYLSKGDKIYLEGRLKTRKWQDAQGVERYSTEVNVINFTFLTTKNSNNSQQQAQPQQPAQGTTQQGEEDDLPF